MGKPSSPKPPDYAKAAEATAEGDLENARYTTLANRPDIYTPEYSQTWQQGAGFDQAGYDAAMESYNKALEGYNSGGSQPANGDIGNAVAAIFGKARGGQTGSIPFSQSASKPTMPSRADFMTEPDKWTGTLEYTPEVQELYDKNTQMMSGLGDIGLQSVEQIGDLFSQRFSVDGQAPTYTGPQGELPTYGENRQQVVDAMMSRVNSDISRDRESASSRLIAQGIPPGSEAYNRQMEMLDRKQTDARQQAEIAAAQMAGQEYSSALAGRGMQGKEALTDYTTGMDTWRQSLQDALLERQTPLNEISAFRTGSQVALPQFQPYGQQSFTGGPDLLGAANSQSQWDLGQYNADVAQRNAMMGGLFSLGSAYLGR